MELVSSSSDMTEEFGRVVGGFLNRGAFLALFGGLGGGKTCFTRGVVTTVAPESAHLVASPTFAIMNEYPGRVPVYHFDFYRLNNGDEIAELGFDDYFCGNGVCIAEWSERLGHSLPHDHLSITFELLDKSSRRILVGARGAVSTALLAKIDDHVKQRDFF